MNPDLGLQQPVSQNNDCNDVENVVDIWMDIYQDLIDNQGKEHEFRSE